jgi:hypothetical protein
MTTEVTDQMLNEGIARVAGDTFDSHAIIRDVMTEHPREYVKDLYTHVESTDPIQTYHATLGKRLAGLSGIERTETVVSANVRGQNTSNQGWKKKP